MADLTDTSTDRRTFLRASAAAATTVAGAQLCGGCALFNKKDEDVIVDPDQSTFSVSLAKHPALSQPGGFVRIAARDGDERIIMVRQASGQVVAVSMVCTHWGCDIDYSAEDEHFVCPCHGSRFQPTGELIEGPADQPLRRFVVVDQGDTITVELPPASDPG